jgi:hypothetical protein
MPVDCQPGRPEGCGLEEIVNVCGSPAWQALGVGPGIVENVQACAGLRGAQWSRDHVYLWITSLAGLRGAAGGAELVQACADLGVWPGENHVCLWITSLAGFRGTIWQRLCMSEG